MVSVPLQDSDALTRMQQVILQLQAEVDRISSTAQSLLEDSADKQKSIDVSMVTSY